MSKRNTEGGFSLIEVLLVCVIIGIIAAVAIPNLQKATKAAENASMKEMLRVLYTAETTYFSQRGRFGRLDEIYPALNNQATLVGDKIVRGNHSYEMVPATDDELRSSFTITAMGIYSDPLLESWQLDESGAMGIYP